MASLLEDLEGIIVALGCATADGVDIFRDSMPDTPNNAIALYEYFGEPFQSAEGIFRSVQVKVRRDTYSIARADSWQIYDALHNPDDKIFTLGQRPALIFVRNTPTKLDTDSTGRTTFYFNMNITTKLD